MQTLTPERRKELELKANDVREGIIRSLLAACSGHSAGSLDMADVFTALYGFIMRHNPQQPDWPERDRLLLSCGHIAPVRYSAMANFGYFRLASARTPRAPEVAGTRNHIGTAGRRAGAGHRHGAGREAR
jgi:transketolase